MKKLLLLYRALEDLNYTIIGSNGETINIVYYLKNNIKADIFKKGYTGDPKIIDDYIVMYNHALGDFKFYPKEEIDDNT